MWLSVYIHSIDGAQVFGMAGQLESAEGHAGVMQLAVADQRQAILGPVHDQERIYHKLAAGELVTGRGDMTYSKPDKPTVYLTFDDGPSALTPQVLDILAEEKVRATFFVLGQLAEQHADTVKRIVEDGHAIGNHTYDHDYERLYKDFAMFFKQVVQTDEIIYRTTGARTPLFRAPGGTYRHFDPFYSYYMEQAGYTVYDWDVDSGDSRRRGVPAAEIIANVLSAPLKHEMIVLLHDGSGHEETVKALPEIIRYYKRSGYQFAVLDAAVEPRRFTLGSPKWKRTTSWQEHVQHMELIAAYRASREAATTDATVTEERLMLIVNGRRYELRPEDYYVLNGHFQVKLTRLTEALGADRIRLGAVCCGDPSGERTYHLANGSRLAYAQSDPKGLTREPSVERLHIILAAHATAKDGELYLPLRRTVELLGGAIPSYDLSRAVKEVRVRLQLGS
jgi:peptidoglycan/xylan/chitin deacetylase (PgdA/CDA1 family)